MTSPSSCVFCKKIADMGANDGSTEVVSFAPLNPVTEGHLLVVPVKHVANMSEDPKTTALTMDAAAILSQAWDSCNIITSKGAPATQTVQHLHLHIVPRRADDDLRLPWTDQDAN